ncbi:guanylate kinase [Cryptosporidium ubiquitum]|uniref:guanylate kinase n=1 Tax=Cryptosporidium ubiquitum TaxID=857276 RepID=A0A1J4MMK3_9CRYT|nr:guanylate kinase [Cryptosporidium ubiquitum]OII74093.1 guanylate kinase [Cryptosporidium ubiquitum]
MKDILVICGPSGVGKGTLISYLMKEFPEKFGFSISHTSRCPRGGESNGKEYHFCSSEEFKSMISIDGFVEYAEVHEHFYGTSKQAIENIIDQGKICLIDIDVQGVEQIQKSSFGDRAYYIGILPKSQEDLEKRLRKRKTDSDQAIQVRLKNSTQEIERIKCNPNIYKLVNDDLETACNEIGALVKSFWEDISQ